MSQITYANVIVESTSRALAYPTLYYRADKALIVRNTHDLDGTENVNDLHGLDAVDSHTCRCSTSCDEYVLTDAGSFDFTTYFNALSVAKLSQYTDAQGYMLHLELKGAACEYVQMMGNKFSSFATRVEGTNRNISASDDWQSIDIPLVTTPEMVLTGFMLHTQGQVIMRHAYYALQIDHELRDVELALVTTTYRKEAFIARNIKRINQEILCVRADMDGELVGNNSNVNNGSDISRHFHMYVIDNGRTLDTTLSATSRIKILPNNNVGGSGGFAYGMITAMEQHPKATHVLLMDDDVDVSPESIKRTYALLRMLKDEYKEAFISGAMLSYEIGDEQWEDTGYMTQSGAFAPAKPPLRLTQFEDVVYNEVFQADQSLDGQRYASWWYCCIPMSTIEREGLPLPLFVRSDDAEYSMRCKPEFITVNGLCIWHMAFQSRYNEAVERYQTTRNTMIAQAVTGMAPKSDFMTELDHNIHIELQKFGYQGAMLCLDAFEDFLKGPEFIQQSGIAEASFMRANKRKEQLVNFDELMNQVSAIPELSDFDITQIDRYTLETDQPRSLVHRIQDRFIDNGQRIVKTEGEGYAVISALGWAYPAGLIRNKKYIIIIDWSNAKGAIRRKNQQQYDAIMKRYRRDLQYYKRHIDRLRAEYAAARPELTSVAYWKRYLCNSSVTTHNI